MSLLFAKWAFRLFSPQKRLTRSFIFFWTELSWSKGEAGEKMTPGFVLLLIDTDNVTVH